MSLAVANMIMDPLWHSISYLSVLIPFRGQAAVFILYQLAIAMKQSISKFSGLNKHIPYTTSYE